MTTFQPLAKLQDLAAKAGRWLGLAAPTPAHTQVVASDRWDQATYAETYSQAKALQGLADDLAAEHDYTGDLLQDVFNGAIKAAPHVRGRDDVDPSRAINHQVVSSLLDSDEFKELRRNTIGDAYAAAMAVLAQGAQLQTMLDAGREAQQAAKDAAEARQQAAQAAADVQAALEAAAEAADADGNVPDDAAAAVAAATQAAQAADDAAGQAGATATAALAQAAPRIRTAARAAAQKAADTAQAEADMMAAWGISRDQRLRMSFAERARLATRLSGNRLTEFAALIGRFRTMAAGERARRVEPGLGELVGITIGSDITRLVPSELANLALPATRAEFAARFVEGRLMQYDARTDDTAGRGAIIALVDCSASMRLGDGTGAGTTREAWAKACALALLDQARAQRRDYTAILFASDDQQQLFSFPAGQADIEQVLDLAGHFWAGNTDFQVPLGQAAEILARQHDTDGIQKGDIVLITDGECDVDADWLDGWRKLKTTLAFRVFGISIAQRPGAVLEELCDNLRHVSDLGDVDQSRDMFRAI